MRPVLLALSLCTTLIGHAQLLLNGTLTAEQLVQNTLLGTGVTVSNVTFNNLPGNLTNPQVGFFDGSATVLAMDSGLVLCTGGITVAPGPNNSGSMQVEVLDNFLADDDLDNVAADMCMDIASLEFDFVPTGDSISFSYSFASEEYLEWVNLGYNDAFGFFLSGPGIFGPFQDDAVNLAVVPGTFSYVSVNTINDAVNSAYYQDNGDGSQAPYSTDPYYIQFDGFTVNLKASAAVQCGQTYHIKMAIGDVGDPNWDSGVFIQGGTFSSTGGVGISIATSSGTNTVSEGCDNAVVTIARSGTSGTDVLPIVVSGTASAPADVTGIPASVTIPDGQSTVSFPIQFSSDLLTEGNETLTLCVALAGSCGGGNTSCAILSIIDGSPIIIAADDVISDCSGNTISLSALATGGSGALNYAWNTGSTMAFIVVPDAPTAYEVTVTDDCGSSASATVNVIAPCGIQVPNVFTPNGDGQNDVFEITGIEYLSNQVRVYNRWGQVVFEAANYKNTWAANDVSDGTYYYEVIADGLAEPLTGHLTILNNRH